MTKLTEGRELTDSWWVSQYNFADDVRRDWDLRGAIELHDVTLREAEQGRPIIFSTAQRVELAEALSNAGVRRIELMPEVSSSHLESLRTIVKAGLPLDVYALCRIDRTAIDQAIDAGATGINLLNASINPWVLENVVGWQPEELIDRVTEAIEYVRSQGVHAVVGSGDAFRTPTEFYKRYLTAAVEAGASGVKVNDSFGFSLPDAVSWLVRQVRSWVGQTPIQIHVHNDFGLSLASALAAVTAGADVVDVAINGYGERGGNTPLEEAAVALQALLGVDSGVVLEELFGLSTTASSMAGIPLALNKPIVGPNLHVLWTGLHANWRTKATAAGRSQAWSPIAPEAIGKPGYEVILGPMSGVRSVQIYFSKYGLELPDAVAAAVRDEVKKRCSERQEVLADPELLDIASGALDHAGLANTVDQPLGKG